MKLILTTEVDHLGSAGDLVEVKDGYGRNYLLPRGFAIPATRGAERQSRSVWEVEPRDGAGLTLTKAPSLAGETTRNGQPE